MRKFGKKGYAVNVRYEPTRNLNAFSISVGNRRLSDTDNPVMLLKKVYQYFDKIPVIKIKFLADGKVYTAHNFYKNELYYRDIIGWRRLFFKDEGSVWTRV